MEFLQRAQKHERHSHAYLLVGPPQVGKRTLALEFARAISCTGTPKPCGQCRSCVLASRGHHPDIMTVRGEGAGGAILVDQIRAIRREASLSPMEGRHRIYVICNVHLANENAANALLKTLEEPPRHVLFLLTATAEELVPPTILSRCQVVRLQPLARQEVEDALIQRWAAPPEQATLLARLSGGRLGKALSMLQSKQPLERRAAVLDQLQELSVAGWVTRFSAAEEIAGRSADIRELLEVWLTWWRDMLFLHTGLRGQIVNIDRIEELERDYRRFDEHHVQSALQALQTCTDCIQKNVGARLALEWLMLQLPTASP